ncbi:1,4-alpha-glucan branching protein GlgB [Streptomyces sp. WMMB 322]|uniref:1,4-alpha-glucan branching protein GlgB n=1 Tax=Streptomyces sp. WMMB 322 TaxID=1286821 RepID=UPI000823F1B7|nr:1,4-alpha-glucan branching protein GlgB [Streptomyces sp. WMMB 322]SCK54962.1 1,4-alpha-glucan branching enzyme [Streptomyces sp. WMMB 322]
MTASQLPPDPTGRVRPPVPATFLPGRADGPAGDARADLSPAALTGLPAGPPRGLVPPERARRGKGRRRAAQLPQTAAPEAAGLWTAEVRTAGGRTTGSRTPASPAAGARPPAHKAPPARRDESGPGSGPAAHRAAAAPALPGEDRARLLAGTHRNPHAHLGAHAVPGGAVRFRVLRPFARSVTVVVQDGDGERRAELPDEGDGFFAGELTLPGDTDEDGVPADTGDHSIPAGTGDHSVPADTGEGVGQDGSARPDAPRRVPGYELLVRYGERPGEDEVRVRDPYGFPPAVDELDLRLFSEGRHAALWKLLGARTMTHRGVTGTRFTVWAPNARGVRVAGDFNRWDAGAFPMRSLGPSGVWELFLPHVGDGALYKFEVVRDDGSRVLHADPVARATEVPPATASVVHTSTFRWSDGDWLDRRAAGRPHAAPLSVYEVHLPSWHPGLTYRELAVLLPAYVKDLGFTHVELMPCAEHPFGGSWGYQVTGFYAPTSRLGSPDDFKYLVDSLHRAGIGVLMDWVPAHFPKDEWGLARFDGSSLYEHPDPSRAEHPDWGTLEFDFGRREVRDFLIGSAVHWCEEFHIDGLRVDAVASMLYLDYSRGPGEWTPNSRGGRENPDAVALLQEMNATLHRRCPGVITAAEESTTWDGVTRPTDQPGEGGFGGLGFDFKWNMGWMHDSLGYMRLEPRERTYRGAQLARAMSYAYSESFILPVSHDEVVHGKGSLVRKMPGDARQQRADHRAFLGFMWAHPGKQLLFMGQEFAQESEWSEERGPDWRLLDFPSHGNDGHRGVRDLVRDLNSRYTSTPALWQLDTDPSGFSWVADGTSGAAGLGGESVLAFLRFDAARNPLLAVSNFSSAPVDSYRLGVPHTDCGAWREVLNTDDARYGGGGTGNPGTLKSEAHPAHGHPASITPVLPARATLWFRPA